MHTASDATTFRWRTAGDAPGCCRSLSAATATALEARQAAPFCSTQLSSHCCSAAPGRSRAPALAGRWQSDAGEALLLAMALPSKFCGFGSSGERRAAALLAAETGQASDSSALASSNWQGQSIEHGLQSSWTEGADVTCAWALAVGCNTTTAATPRQHAPDVDTYASPSAASVFMFSQRSRTGGLQRKRIRGKRVGRRGAEVRKSGTGSVQTKHAGRQHEEMITGGHAVGRGTQEPTRHRPRSWGRSTTQERYRSGAARAARVGSTRSGEPPVSRRRLPAAAARGALTPAAAGPQWCPCR